MSDKLTTSPITTLLRWILNEEKSGHIFGIARELFFTPAKNDPFRMHRYGRTLETPIGVAAGPHTQLAQNIISAWLCGARYIELKTVQVLDSIEVSKPCIDMEDEGYNCEWSQELSIEQSFDQYLDAWILIHLLRHRFGWREKQPGFIFNMSVGYDMKGILSDKVQWFLDKMADCRQEKETKLASIIRFYPALKEIDIPDRISDNVTLSTMHGCPADEIEQIGRWLIEERGLHTTIKLNPTLLGPETLRNLLNQKLGYDVDVPDEAFKHDLKYEDAIGIIKRLRHSAEKRGVAFGLKLTNTLETSNRRGVLPAHEKMIYMSGRALHPISVALAAKLQADFAGALDISFSAGADCFNTPELIAAGLAPVTVCSDLLKPGGYGRLTQYLSELFSAMQAVDAAGIDDFIVKKSAGKTGDSTNAALHNLLDYAGRASRDIKYDKNNLPEKSIKTPRELTPFDCIQAPCVNTCPAHQAVPEYMYHTAHGDDAAAFNVVMATNPLPTVTGLACDHSCQTKCTRQNIDAPLRIRDIKRFIAERNSDERTIKTGAQNGLRAAIIGAGPSGLACAWRLALAGFEVHIYESGAAPGGMLANAIPRFRLPDEALLIDVNRVRELGVTIHEKSPITADAFEKLRRENDYIYIAVGAQENKKLNIPGEELPGVFDALKLLAAARHSTPLSLGRRVAVIGGGDSAVDAARTARRLVDQDGDVRLIYRRTQQEMPANRDELQELLNEKIDILELAAPMRIEKHNDRLRLHLQKMRLGDRDDSGRRSPVPIPGEEFTIEVDAVISAIGQNVVLNFMPNGAGHVRADLQTTWDNVFIGGDALRGPATIIAAIADGQRAAKKIQQSAGISSAGEIAPTKDKITPAQQQVKMAQRQFGPPEQVAHATFDFDLPSAALGEKEARAEADRCLYCDDICNVCVSVCPNRANISYEIEPVRCQLQQIILKDGKPAIVDGDLFIVEQRYQVFNIVDFCNECGNCATFCPTSGAPWRDKPRVCLSEEAFRLESSAFLFTMEEGKPSLLSKNDDRIHQLTLLGDIWRYESDELIVDLERNMLKIKNVSVKQAEPKTIRIEKAAEMSVLLEALTKAPWANGLFE